MTMTPNHILVPIDFSSYANLALDYAMNLGKILSARLTLLHVIHSTPLGVPGMETEPADYTSLQELEADVRQLLEEMLAEVRNSGLQADIDVVHGVPYQEIVDTAKAKHVDLIIMGSHGRTGLAHTLLGSVAERVVRLASCPVLVVREREA